MKKRWFIVVGVATVLAVICGAVYYLKPPADRCSAQDRAQNNCVPAGRCTPPGDPRESAVDCQTKNYDHKFVLGK